MAELVGLLPAAGRALRLGAIPCSKEIMPLGFRLEPPADDKGWQAVTAIETHLRALQVAGATRVAIVISETKYDVVRYIGDGGRYGLRTAYLFQQQLRGMPHALELATPWIGDATTLFSMPDTLITPYNTMSQLVEYHQHVPADVTLGLFHTATPNKFGMVRLDIMGRVVGFVDKPEKTDLHLMWGLGVWSSTFTRFMSRYLSQQSPERPECVLSDVFQSALESGLNVQGLLVDGAQYHDIGTPEDFQAVVYRLALRQATAE